MFIKLYLDIFGLYIGGYIAWIILGLAGASRSPVWNPKNKMNQSEEKKKNKELKKAEKKSKNELRKSLVKGGSAVDPAQI